MKKLLLGLILLVCGCDASSRFKPGEHVEHIQTHDTAVIINHTFDEADISYDKDARRACVPVILLRKLPEKDK